MILKKIWSYLTFEKQPEFENDINAPEKTAEHLIADDETEPSPLKKMADTKFLSMMHGINRISIIMFIFGIIVVVIKILKK